MEESNSFRFNRDDLVGHLGEVEFACQLFQSAALSGNSCDVAVFQQSHCFLSRSAITILEIFQDLIYYELVDLAQFFELIAHKQAGRIQAP